MGIRTLNRRTTPAPANVNTEAAPSTEPPSVPPFAARASTARIPTDLVTALRLRATACRRRLPRRAQDWADLTRSYLALARALLPRSRPVRTVTVFIATAGTVTEPQADSPPDRPHPNASQSQSQSPSQSPHPHPHQHPHSHHQGPAPDATP